MQRQHEAQLRYNRYEEIMELQQNNNNGFYSLIRKIHLSMLSISISYNEPSIIVTTMHRREQTIYLQLINKKKENKSNVLLVSKDI
jgi:hypothetical protein